MSSPFTTKLFAPSGSPDGVIVAFRDDWPGRAIIFPRELVGEVKGRKMHIGEGDPVGARIDSHVANKDFWRRGLIFTAEGRRLNKAHIQHLESRLVSLAKEAGRIELMNGNHPKPPVLSEEELAFCENFLQQILLTLPLLGFWQFRNESEADGYGDEEEVAAIQEEKSLDEASVGKRAQLYASLPQGIHFNLSTKGIQAKLVTTENGVTVLKGSYAVNDITASFDLRNPNYASIRKQLQEAEILVPMNGQLRFSQDQFFSSGSAAASIVSGGSSSSDWWRTDTGKTLGDFIREAKDKP